MGFDCGSMILRGEVEVESEEEIWDESDDACQRISFLYSSSNFVELEVSGFGGELATSLSISRAGG